MGVNDSNSIGSYSKREDTHLQQSELRRGTERLMGIFTGTTLDCTRVGTIRTTQWVEGKADRTVLINR
jgi:hypothetical protein